MDNVSDFNQNQAFYESKKFLNQLINNGLNSEIEKALYTQQLFSQLIIHENNEEVLLNKICEITVNEVGYKLAWMGIAMKDKTVLPISSAGFSQDYIKNIKITWGDDQYSEGPTGQAIKTGKFFVMQDILHNPIFNPWKENAIKHGFKSSIAIPVFYNNEVLGALNIYSEKPYAFNDEEIKILSLAASDLSIGISNIRHKKIIDKQARDLKRAKDKAEENEKLFRNVFENSPTGISIAQMDGTIRVNKAFCDILGYSSVEFNQKHWKEITHPDDILPTETAVASLLKGEHSTIQFEKKYFNKTGNIILADVRMTLQKNDRGDPMYFITTITDITKRKNEETELHRHRIQLEELVKERTKELEQKNSELSNFNNLFVGREFRIKELKENIKELKDQLKHK